MLLDRLIKQTSWIAALLLVSWLALHLSACLMQTSDPAPMMMTANSEQMQTMDHHGDCCDEQVTASTSCDQLGESVLHAKLQITGLFFLLFCLPLFQLISTTCRLHFWLCLYPLPIRSGRPPTRLRFCTWRD